MAYGASDITFMLTDFGELVVFGAYTTRAVLDYQTDVQDMGNDMAILGQTISIRYEVSKLPGLKRASAITVAGTSYKVREIHLLADGLIARAFLEVP